METALERLILSLPRLRTMHAPGTLVYKDLQQVARGSIEALYSGPEPEAHRLGPFGDVALPYYSMGMVDSLNLFDLDEIIIFSFYWANQRLYRHVADMGANIGLHSIVLSRCGFRVRAYEPDPFHFTVLKRNLSLNRCANVEPFQVGISSVAREVEFIRVLDNTTGSHIAGAKPNPYGPLQRIPVRVIAAGPVMEWADLVKMDVEGQEREILLSTNKGHWSKTDALVEVGSSENAVAIYDHLESLGINLFSQKTNWKRVSSRDDMPTSYKEGTLFITTKADMPWPY